MSWLQISVITDEQIAPLLADAFADQGAVSVTFLDAEDEPVYEPAVGETKIWSHTEVVALYQADTDAQAIAEAVGGLFMPDALRNWRFERIEDQEWERAWMDHYRPMKFGDTLWVCPTGQEQREAGSVCLILDPGLAFGTGTHPTTALCLEWLAGFDLAGKTVIDYGCGSGILAIAAVLLGAETAHAVDIDPQALTATADNARKNAVEDKIFRYLPQQLPPLRADIVLANILAKPLCELNETLCSHLVTGGRLVLSGILAEQADTVLDAYCPQIEFDRPTRREDWVRLTGIKR